MIKITKAIEPPFFSAKTIKREQQALLALASDISKWRQGKVKFKFPQLMELKTSLLAESNGKCVYCEQALHGPSFMELDHFRPINGAIGVDGERSDIHYFWLAYDWNNMFASCAECNRAKGTKFPVASYRVPAVVYTEYDEVEHPLIINPSRLSPEHHISFREDGTVFARTTEGQYSIDILKLNRSGLIERRRSHAQKFMHSLKSNDVSKFLDSNAEFAGLCRELHKINVGDESKNRLNTSEIHGHVLSQPVVEADQEDAQKMALARYYARFPLITSISITGLFGHKAITLNIAHTENGAPPWLAILGENGVGKTSILKAIVLALNDGDALQEMGLRPADVLCSDAAIGSVIIKFDSGNDREFHVDREGKISRGNIDTEVLLLAYGATRLAGKDNTASFENSQSLSHVKNLFDPCSRLCSPGAWLASLNEREFDYAAGSLKQLLSLPDDAKFLKKENGAALLVNDLVYDLSVLSQGYQSLLSIACDAMSAFQGRWKSIEAAQGIVLIDELENHLHPAWKMRVVSSLRRAFPRVQFIYTTHDPLCLRGLLNNEVAVLRNEAGFLTAAEVIQDLPPVSEMRVDQILTSPYFGLRSTVDPEVEEIFEEYYNLLEKDLELLTHDENDRLQELKLEVKKYEISSLLDRDRLLYEVIDRYLAKRNKPIPRISDDFDPDLLAELDRIVELVSNDRI
jgi:uncharacterized protein (TIGR02646 family)